MLSLTVNGQDYNQDIIEQNQIKSIKKYSYKIENEKNVSNGLIEYHLFDKKGNLSEKYVKHWTTPTIKYSYDSLGNLIEKVNYKADGTKNEIYTWEYNNRNLLIKHITYFSWNDRCYTNIYVYNGQDQNIEIYELNDSGEKYKITTMKFYDSGELLEKRFENKDIDLVRVGRFDKCGSIIYKSEHGRESKFKVKHSDSCEVNQSLSILKSDTIKFSEKGRDLIKVIETSLNKKVVTIRDNEGHLVSLEEYEYFQDSTISHSEISFFNEQGQLIEAKTFYSGKDQWACSHSTGNPPDSYYHFKYEYYDNGLKKIVNYYDQKGMKTEYAEYEVETYK